MQSPRSLAGKTSSKLRLIHQQSIPDSVCSMHHTALQAAYREINLLLLGMVSCSGHALVFHWHSAHLRQILLGALDKAHSVGEVQRPQVDLHAVRAVCASGHSDDWRCQLHIHLKHERRALRL